MDKVSYGYDNEMNLKLVIALSRSLQYLRKGESQQILDAGLTIAQFSVLEVLYHKGDLRICEIIEKTLSTGGNMTVVVNNLIKEGLVSRCKDSSDARASVITLTDKGRGIIGDLFPKHVEKIKDLMSGINMAEKEQLLGLLKKFNGWS